jgi:hypothetical protein
VTIAPSTGLDANGSTGNPVLGGLINEYARAA